MNFSSNKNISGFFVDEAKLWYKLVVFFFFVGFLLDILLHFDSLPNVILYSDFFILFFIIILYSLALKRIISEKISFLSIAYVSTILLLFSYYYGLFNGTFTFTSILQDFITIPAIILSMGFLGSKRHLVIMGAIFVIFYPLVLYLTGTKFLMESSIFVAVMIFASSLGMFIVVRTLEKAMEMREASTEELRKQRDQMVKLNEERTKLFAIISHDLRNPIGNSVNISKMLLNSNLDENDRKTLTESLHKMNVKVYSMLEDLLTWSKNEYGLFSYEPEVLNLREAVESVIDLFSSNIKEKSLNVLNLIKKDVLVYSDRKILDTILRNLLSNAIKFTHTKGEIVFATIQTADELTLVIRDSGIGMSEERLDEIFSGKTIKSFEGTNNEKGTGLGLQLVKNLAEKNKGSLSVESVPNKGTTFLVTIPYPEEEKSKF